MMILADLTAGDYHDYSDGMDSLMPYVSKGSDEDDLFGNSIGYFVAQKYKKAKTSFVWGGADSASEFAAALNIGGMTHGHMPGTYYFLSNNCNFNNN